MIRETELVTTESINVILYEIYTKTQNECIKGQMTKLLVLNKFEFIYKIIKFITFYIMIFCTRMYHLPLNILISLYLSVYLPPTLSNNKLHLSSTWDCSSISWYVDTSFFVVVRFRSTSRSLCTDWCNFSTTSSFPEPTSSSSSSYQNKKL